MHSVSQVLYHSALLANQNLIQKDASPIVRPISQLLGYIMDFFFNIAYSFTEKHSLGIAIILLTIAIRFLMLPLSFKSQKSMAAMQKLQPEINKIKEKYGDSKDPELQQKMNRDIQLMYTKHKINPFGGCLPVLLQFPIFIALSYLMQQSFLFISKLGDIYSKMVAIIVDIPKEYLKVFKGIAVNHIPPDMIKDNYFDAIETNTAEKILNKFTSEEWKLFLESIPADIANQFTPLLNQKESIEFFAGINLNATSGWTLPGIIIPVLCALATFLSSYLMMKQQTSTDQNAKTQQQIMLVVMPLLMGYMTVNLPSGVGLYWIISSVFQLFQQILMNKYYNTSNKA